MCLHTCTAVARLTLALAKLSCNFYRTVVIRVKINVAKFMSKLAKCWALPVKVRAISEHAAACGSVLIDVDCSWFGRYIIFLRLSVSVCDDPLWCVPPLQ